MRKFNEAEFSKQIKRVKCKSGTMGERSHLRTVYADFEEFSQWSSIYGLSKRLGFRSDWKAWDANPVVESSVLPEDYRRVQSL